MIENSSILVCFLILLLSSHLTFGSLDVKSHETVVPAQLPPNIDSHDTVTVLPMSRCVVIKSGFQYELSTGTSNGKVGVDEIGQNYPNVYLPMCGIEFVFEKEAYARIHLFRKKPSGVHNLPDAVVEVYCDNQPNAKSRGRCLNFLDRFWDIEQLRVSCSLPGWGQLL